MNLTLLTPENRSEFDLRISKIRSEMERAELDAILVGSTSNIFYISGGIFRGYIYVSLNDAPLFFMIPPSEFDSEMVIQIHKPEQIPDILASTGYGKSRRLGMEYSDLPYSDIVRLQKAFSGIETADCSGIMRRARSVKTDYEIGLMRQDGIRQVSVYSQIKHCYSPDMTDLEFQIEIERILRREGCLGYLRAAGTRMELNMGSVLAGPNADEPSPYDFSMGGAGIDASLPVGASGEIMKPGMAVMVDMNGGFNGYQTDITRCWTIGEPTEKALTAHEVSRTILRDLESFARPGVEVGELYRRALRLEEDAGLADYFMGHRHKVQFIGHGVGIELNEQPVVMSHNREPLKKNMTIALEPKFVLPEIGAVGVENTYLVTENGLENLTVLHEELVSL